MKQNRPFIIDLGPYGDTIFSLLTFCSVVGMLFWVIRAGCAGAFEAIAGH